MITFAGDRRGFWGRKAGILGSAALLVGWLAPGLPAQDSELREEIGKLIQIGKSSLSQEIAVLIEKHSNEAAAAVVKVLEARLQKRLAELEKALKEKEAKIADLESKLAALTKPTEAEQPAAAPKPEPKPAPSNAFLGVAYIDHKDGALVTALQEEGPATLAGLQQNDIIAALNGKAVSWETLNAAVTGHKPGDAVKLDVLRGGQKVELTAKLVDREAFFKALASKQAEKPQKVELGIVVEEIPDGGGTVVVEVEKGYTGEAAGLAQGDRITKVNGKDIKVPEDIAAELKKLKVGDKLTINTLRGDEEAEIVVLAAAGKEGVKLISRTAHKRAAPVAVASPAEEKKPAEAPKPAAEKKPVSLGIRVVAADRGLLVDDLVPNTAAVAYGVQKGDIVIKANGTDLRETAQLRAILEKLSPGDKMSLVVVRGGRTVEIKDIVLGARGEVVKAPAAAPAEAKPAVRQKGRIGFSASKTSEDSLTVSAIDPGLPADKAGIKPGDILLKVGDRVIKSFDDLEAVLKDVFAGDTITLRVKRNGEEKEFQVTLVEAPGEE
jgi:S1-C subfamily serine protease